MPIIARIKTIGTYLLRSLPLPRSRVPLSRSVAFLPTRKKSNLFKTKMENNVIKNTLIKDVRNLFRLKKETKAIKDEDIRYIKTLFELEQ